MNVWVIAIIALAIGAIPGLIFFPWMASPFGGLGPLAPPFARIFFTVSQMIRGRGVLVKRATGQYEIGTYSEIDDDTVVVELSDGLLELDSSRLEWGLFGKRPFAVTWEPGTPLHERISDTESDKEADGLSVNLGALHRLLRGVNNEEAITRTEEKAKAKYGGGSQELSDLTMALLIGGMLVLGSVTTWLMIG